MDAVRVALLREVLAGTEWLGATRRFAQALRGSVVAHGGGLLLVGTAEYEPWHLAAHLVDEAAWSGTPELAPTLVRHHARPSDPPHLAVGPGRIEAARRGETLLVVAPEGPGLGGGLGSGAGLGSGSGPGLGSGSGHGLGPRPGSGTGPGQGLGSGSGPGPGPGLAWGPVSGLGSRPGPGPGSQHGPGPGPGPGSGSAEAAELLERVHAARRAGVTVLSLGAGGGELAAMSHDTLAVPAGAELDLDSVQHLVSAAAGENAGPPRSRRGFRDRLTRLAEALTAPPPAPW